MCTYPKVWGNDQRSVPWASATIRTMLRCTIWNDVKVDTVLAWSQNYSSHLNIQNIKHSFQYLSTKKGSSSENTETWDCKYTVQTKRRKGFLTL